MNVKLFYCSFVILTLCICTKSLWAQDYSTRDGLTFTLDSSIPSNADIQDMKVSKDMIISPLEQPVILNFDSLPGPLWETWDCGDGVSKAEVSHGILTIDAPSSCYEFDLWYPNGKWHQFVDNTRGWVIETSLRVDPSTQPECGGGGSVQIWANDHTNLVIIGFSTNEICIAYPDNVHFPMNTTDNFHIYQIKSKGNQVQIYVDGDLKIDHILSWTGGGSNILMFGDGVGGTTSLSYWDYFSYDVFPHSLLVTLSNFTVNLFGNKTIQANWLTGTEENNDGMNVWCAQMKNNQFEHITRLNGKKPIPTGVILPFSGNHYSVSNEVKPEGVYYCALEDIDHFGECTTHCEQMKAVIVGNATPRVELDDAKKLCYDSFQGFKEATQLGVCVEKLLARSP